MATPALFTGGAHRSLASAAHRRFPAAGSAPVGGNRIKTGPDHSTKLPNGLISLNGSRLPSKEWTLADMAKVTRKRFGEGNNDMFRPLSIS